MNTIKPKNSIVSAQNALVPTVVPTMAMALALALAIALSCGLLSPLLFGSQHTVRAQQFVYEPLNPSFGGNPMNYQWLMNSANVQNQHEATALSRLVRDPIADFQASLQRQVLSQLTRDIIRRQMGDDTVIKDSRFEFGEFNIELVPDPSGLKVIISNVLTGEQTSVTIPNY